MLQGGMRRSLAGLVVSVVAVTVLVSCSGGTSTSSSSTAAPQTTASSVDPVAFGTGLAWFFTDSSATTPATVPATLTTCTRDKLDDADATLVAGLKDAKAANSQPDAWGIRVFRAATTCDRGTVQTLFIQETDLSTFGATSDQKTCLANQVVDNIAALDDTNVTSTGGEVLRAPLTATLDSCVPLVQGLTALLSDPTTGIPAAQVDCIAGAAAKTLTWAQILDKSNEQVFKNALTTAAAACKPA